MNIRRNNMILQFMLLIGLLSIGGVMAEESKLLKPLDGFNMNLVERGRYLSKIAGCNDCHTPGFLLSEGNVAEENWFTGDTFGWRGPWGTTYGSNLRIYINALTENQWVTISHALRSRPPMPWFNLNAMHDEDLKAIYQFIKYLGPRGDAAPAYLSPGIEPKTPYALFPPQHK